MRSRKAWVLGGALLALAAMTGASEAATCDRACLRTVLDQYLNAVIKHDPSAAPLAIGVRQTENAIAIAPGAGVWKSITGLGKLQRRYFDPVEQAAGYYGTVVEGNAGSVVTLRLKIADRKVTEAEWIIGRTNTGTATSNAPGSTSVEGAESAPPPEGPLPKEKRVSREAMMALANSYFDSLQSGDPTVFQSYPQFIRVENGIGTGTLPAGGRRGGGAGPVAGGPAPAPRAGSAGQRVAGPGPADGTCPNICAVAGRRFPLVDEEAGVVLGMVVFIRPSGNAGRRLLLSEWFTIDSAKVRGIYAAMHYLSQTIAAPNWPPYDGNFPLSPYIPGSDLHSRALAPVPTPAQ